MPKLELEFKTKQSAKGTFSTLKKILPQHPRFKKLDPSFTCKFHSNHLNVDIKSKLFKAHVSLIENKSQTTIKIKGEIPFAMALFKGQIEKALKSEMNKAFSDLS